MRPQEKARFQKSLIGRKGIYRGKKLTTKNQEFDGDCNRARAPWPLMRRADLQAEENGKPCALVVSVGKAGEGSGRPTGTRGQCYKGVTHRGTTLLNKCAQVTGPRFQVKYMI